MGKVFWFDCETTGLDSEACAIIQLAGLIEIDLEVKESINLFMRPLRGEEKPLYMGKPDIDDEITDQALKVNQRTREEIFKFPHPRTVIDSLKSTLEKYIDKYDPTDKFICGGKNVKFDTDFLWECFRKTENKYYGSYFFSVAREVETLVADMILEKNLKLKNYALGTLCDHFGIELSPHEAMSDIIATRNLYYYLKKELGIETPFHYSEEE